MAPSVFLYKFIEVINIKHLVPGTMSPPGVSAVVTGDGEEPRGPSSVSRGPGSVHGKHWGSLRTPYLSYRSRN